MIDASARPERVVVIGTTGSGKSTLAERIARAIGGEYIDLDALFWLPNWTEPDADSFRAKVAAAITATPRWATAGNYRARVSDITWVAADVIVWIDYPFPLVIWQLFWRTLRRRARNEELWAGNRESLRTQFFSSDSLFVWARQSHWKHRGEWQEIFDSPQMAHVRIVRLRTRGETARYLAMLERS
jgi:adenylate kinase family enzyme